MTKGGLWDKLIKTIESLPPSGLMKARGIVACNYKAHLLASNTECRAAIAVLGKSYLVTLKEKGRGGTPGKASSPKALQSVRVLCTLLFAPYALAHRCEQLQEDA